MIQIDSGFAALLGAVVGGAASALANYLNARLQLRRETLAFNRNISSQHCDKVTNDLEMESACV